MEITDREYGLYAVRPYGFSNRPARSFDWRETNYLSRYRPGATGYRGTIKVDKSEAKSFMDQGEYFLYQQGDKFGWIMLVRNNHTSCEAEYSTLVEAAEAFYVEFYKTLTHWKFEEARKPAEGKEIALLGKWITATEYYEEVSKPVEYKLNRGKLQMVRDGLTTRTDFKVIQDVASDERDDRMFAVGLGDYEVGLCTPTRVRQDKYQYIFNPMHYTLILSSGYTIKNSMDWWVWCNERYVKGEVFCARCRNVYPDVQCCQMKDIRPYGPRCGFSRDDMEDKGEVLDPYSWDFDERYVT